MAGETQMTRMREKNGWTQLCCHLISIRKKYLVCYELRTILLHNLHATFKKGALKKNVFDRRRHRLAPTWPQHLMRIKLEKLSRR